MFSLLTGKGIFDFGTPRIVRAAQPIPFRWQAAGEHRIDVNLVDDQTSKQLKFRIVFCGGTSVRLLLSLAGVEPPEQSPYDVGFTEYDKTHRPRWVVFDYLGEPSGGREGCSQLGSTGVTRRGDRPQGDDRR